MDIEEMTLSIGEAANELGVSTKTLRRWADDGKIPFERSHGGQRRFNQIKHLTDFDKKPVQVKVPHFQVFAVGSSDETLGWIKRLGAPDKEIDNPHSYYYPIKLYSRQRVESFIAERADEYCEWLDKRDQYVEIFEQNKDKIKAGQNRAREAHNLVMEQQSRCLRCASSAFLGGGIFCAIHPCGLEVEQMPCQDFCERKLS